MKLRQAEQSIYFMVFSFTHNGIGKIMQQRFQDGLDVHGVFEARGSDSDYAEYSAMQSLGMAVVTDGNKWIMHHKVIIIDRATVITGSFNFSKNASRTNDENVLIIRGNTDIANLYLEEWQRVADNAHNAGAVPSPSPEDVNVNTASQQQLEFAAWHRASIGEADYCRTALSPRPRFRSCARLGTS